MLTIFRDLGPGLIRDAPATIRPPSQPTPSPEPPSAMRRSGALSFHPADDRRADDVQPLQMIAVENIGAFVAMAFDRPSHWENRIIEIGRRSLYGGDCRAFSRAAGKKLPMYRFRGTSSSSRPEKEIASMFRWFEFEGYHVDIPTCAANGSSS